MRVLVVEDVPRFANRIAEGRHVTPGMAVDVAYDGHEAAAKLDLHPYDVVVLDRDLPGIHGDDLCQMITASPDPAMILMLTAAGTPTDRVAGLALGADDYLPKPFHFPELVLRIYGLALQLHPQAECDSPGLSSLAQPAQPLTGTVTRDGHTIDLTAKERAVLEALLRAMPGALNAEKLLQQAWDEMPTRSPTPSRSRSPDSMALGDPDAIRATPGVGYRIVDEPDGRQLDRPATTSSSANDAMALAAEAEVVDDRGQTY